jgi:gliding motility-associated-like protein
LIGQWTALDGGTILAKNNAKTELSNLSKGAYRFVWSLSSTTCAAYSSDTVRIEIKDGKTPNALDDGAYYLTKDTVSVNVLDNDKNIEIGKILLRLLPSSQGGSKASLQNPSGIFKFVAPVTAKGDFIFRYALCNTDCPDRCDTANITLKQRAIFEGETVLTPNDDGFNDELIVDDIQKFPKNEIYIYNRWGDVVFHQKPYSNDWRGVNRKGQTLSQGSYYYVLFLDIADGEIRTGDILLIR